MPPKERLSKEMKLQRAKEFLVDEKVPYTMTELKTILPKKKGIIYQAVEDIVKELVGDYIVETDKVGTNVIYWCFPATMGRKLDQRVGEIDGKRQGLKRKLEQLEGDIEEHSAGKEPSKKRTKLEEELGSLRAEEAESDAILAEFAENDPEYLNKVKDITEQSREAANRWVDAIFSIRSYAKQKFGLEEARLNKEFHIPKELDYIE